MMIDSTGILTEIKQPTSLERQINALKVLKHDIVGNQLRKETWKSSGVLDLLAGILVSPSVSSTTWRGDEGKVILHAVTIVGSLAYGEPGCVRALEASHLFGGLVRALEAVSVNTAIVLAALRALNNIADSIALCVHDYDDHAFAAAIYSDNGMRNLRSIIELDSLSRRESVLAARLLSKTCVNEARRVQSASHGILDALAAIVRPTRSRPAPNPWILRAIARIVSESFQRAYSFVHRGQHATISWLLELIKRESGSVRLMAIGLATICLRTVDADVGITASMIPMLVQMLEQPSNHTPSEFYPDDERQIMAEAPKVLAALISEDEALQEAAYEAGAVGKLAKLLRQANEAINKDRSKAFWHARQGESRSVSSLPPALFEQWTFREALLKALAAIASKNDGYRKAVVESGAVVPMVDCLKPLDFDALQTDGETIRAVGNPVPVLLAACGAARALSRSVSTLRTSLVDAKLATPVVLLLKHPNQEVQIAATAVVCNIVLEFSPMRQAAVDAGVIRLLCEHAHSSNARLKLNSLWALKHAVHSAPNAIKLQCVGELGPGWLKHALDERMMDTGDDHAIREQALDFVRNLIAGDGNQEMVDYMMQEVGQERLFDLLVNLLSGDSDVTLSTLYILCNLAAGTPRHRQILVSQGNLMKLVAPLFQHDRAEIRSACVWLVINLTWAEDNDDRLNCKARAYELRKMGLTERLDTLADDLDLDVRERTKTAMHQLTELFR